MSLESLLLSPLFEKTDIEIHDETFFRDVLLNGSLGLGNSYIEGKWDSNRIEEITYSILSKRPYQKLSQLANRLRLLHGFFRNPQDREGSGKVIEAHYDLPVEFYAAFLDPFFQYTCALFKDTDNLDEAQIEKMHLICRKLEIKEGQSVLDLGGGWGGLAGFMKEHYGVIPTVLTRSREQAEYIKNTTEGIDVWLADYRDVNPGEFEQFDAVSAVGMFEHIGHKNYSEFFKIVNKSLKPGGKFLLHTLYTPYSVPVSDSWLDEHIFPNGELPPIPYIRRSAKGVLNRYSGLYPHFQELTPNYYPTLFAWDKNLKKSIEKGVIHLSEKEQRKWHYYFMSCAGAIKASHMRVGQFLYSK